MAYRHFAPMKGIYETFLNFSWTYIITSISVLFIQLTL